MTAGRSSGAIRKSAMLRTGRNTSAIIRRTARATSISTSTRSGPLRTSILSASTTICRCRTGAMAMSTSTRRNGSRSTSANICSRTSRAARASTGTTHPMARAPGRSGLRSRTAHTASRGCSATRICAPGGRTSTITGLAACSRQRRPRGCRKASRSASPSWDARRSTAGQTSRMCSWIRNPPSRWRRISRAAGATTPSSAPLSRRCCSTGGTARIIRILRSTRAA